MADDKQIVYEGKPVDDYNKKELLAIAIKLGADPEKAKEEHDKTRKTFVPYVEDLVVAPADENSKDMDDFGTEEFYIEDPKFYEALEKKVSYKENKGDFVFDDAKRNPGRVAIRILPDDAEAPGRRIKGDKSKIKCKKGDFILRDTVGNRLRVAPEVFKSIYKKIIG